MERSLASSEKPCIEDVERNLRLPVFQNGDTVLVRGDSRRLPSLGLDLQVAALSISTVTQASPGRIWKGTGLREQGEPAPAKPLKGDRTTRPSVYRHNVQKARIEVQYFEYRKDFVHIGQWGANKRDGATSRPIFFQRGGGTYRATHPRHIYILTGPSDLKELMEQWRRSRC